MEVPEKQLASLLPDYLARQRWFAGDAPPQSVDIVASRVLDEGPPALVWALAAVPEHIAYYQVVVGLRPLADTETFLEGKGREFLGDLDLDDEAYLAYDALVDPALAAQFLALVAPEEDVAVVRPLPVDASNTSVVFDDRLILKVFRQVHEQSNPDAEVVDGLAKVGFEGVPQPVATWRDDGRDLAVVRVFHNGSTDGWDLARTSLRDLYDRLLPPEECGGDFAPEAERLGSCTAQLHLALAEAFGAHDADPPAWADSMRTADDDAKVRKVYETLAGLDPASAGRSIRIHGDLHLAQALRTDAGWLFLDFEGEPRRPVPERTVPTSPVRDVAGMARSFHYAAMAAVFERHGTHDDVEQLQGLADQWVERNRDAYIEGYLATPGIEALVPTEEAWPDVLRAFELGKAVYEIGYERAHRPDWEAIPASAIARLVS